MTELARSSGMGTAPLPLDGQPKGDGSARILVMDFQPIFMSGYSLGRGHKGFFRNKVRPKIIPHHTPTCSICGFKADERRLIHADEVWNFPGPPQVTLVEIRPLCVYCHDAKNYWHLLLRVHSGIAAARLAGIVQDHYCKINACTGNQFSDDYKIALNKKRELEQLYGYNCALEVDYGQWAPPQRPGVSARFLQSLSPEEQNAIIETIRRDRRRLQSIKVSASCIDSDTKTLKDETSLA